MATQYTKNLRDGQLVIQTAAAWLASTAYVLTDVVRPANGSYTGFEYVCTRAGTSGATEPTWPTTLTETVDDPDVNGAEWTCQAMDEYVEVPFISEGGLKWTEKNAHTVKLDRGSLDHRRPGAEEEMDVSFSFDYTRIKADTGEILVYEILQQIGEAAAYPSQSDDEEPYSVHLVFLVLDESLSKYEVIEFPEFKQNSVSFSEGDETNTVSVDGASFAVRPSFSHLAV